PGDLPPRSLYQDFFLTRQPLRVRKKAAALLRVMIVQRSKHRTSHKKPKRKYVRRDTEMAILRCPASRTQGARAVCRARPPVTDPAGARGRRCVCDRAANGECTGNGRLAGTCRVAGRTARLAQPVPGTRYPRTPLRPG